MKKLCLAITLFALTLNPLMGQCAEEKKEVKLPSLKEITSELKPVVAKVGKVEIKKDEVAKILTEIYPQLSKAVDAGKNIDVKLILKKIVDNMVMDKIMFQEVTEKKIEVSEKELKESVEMIYKRFQGEENFKKFLVQQKLSQEKFESKLKADLQINKLLSTEVYKNVEVSDKEAQEFYDKNPKMFKATGQIKASHILIKYKKSEGEDKRKVALKKIKEIQKQIKNGADFTQLAKEKSEGPSAVKGGDLGFFGKGQMVPAFEKAAFALKKNGVSDIVETPFGFHLIKLYEKKPAEVISLSKVKTQLKERLKATKIEVEVKKYYEELLKKYNVETFI
ncbi:MAG: peptidylprolyl isomerase [Nitrospinae bacterium]|nr:peptidylprolyl isomerase [Nitrospinota bacterium]